jgi:hypothetical protein
MRGRDARYRRKTAFDDGDKRNEPVSDGRYPERRPSAKSQRVCESHDKQAKDRMRRRRNDGKTGECSEVR